MENQNEKAPKMNTGEVKKKRYYKKRKPKAVVANDVVKAEQGSSSPSPAASDAPKPKGKRGYGNPNNDSLGYPKIQTTVNGKTVEHAKTKEAIERAMRISSEMVKAKYAEKEAEAKRDYAKEAQAWDRGAHGYTEAAGISADYACSDDACGCHGESEYAAQVDWDGLLDRLEAMNAAIGSQRVTVWDRIKAFAEGVLEYDRPMYMLLIALLEIRLSNTYWAIGFGCLSITYFVTTSINIVRRWQYVRHVRGLIREGVETYKKK